MAASGPVERYSRYDFYIPGVLLMTGGSFPVGTSERLSAGSPDLDEVIGGRSFTSQAATTLADNTSRYWFCWGPHRRHGDEAVRDVMMGVAGRAFEEDKAMIEVQQKIVDADPSRREMSIVADKGLIMYNRLVERLSRNQGARAHRRPTAA